MAREEGGRGYRNKRLCGKATRHSWQISQRSGLRMRLGEGWAGNGDSTSQPTCETAPSADNRDWVEPHEDGMALPAMSFRTTVYEMRLRLPWRTDHLKRVGRWYSGRLRHSHTHIRPVLSFTVLPLRVDSSSYAHIASFCPPFFFPSLFAVETVTGGMGQLRRH